MHVTLRQLAGALAVARRQSFRRAAEDVHLSQPALSLAVAELERQLGIRLFDRTSRSVRPTAAGADFLAEAGRLTEALQALMRDIRDTAQAHRGRVVVASIASVAARLMPRAMQACAERHPGLDLQMRDDVTIRVFEMVRSGEVDFGVAGESHGSPPELTFEPLLDDPLYVAVPATHPLARQSVARWNDLSGEVLVAFANTSGIHLVVDEQLRRAEVVPRRVVAVSQITVVHGMVEAGIGLSVLPRLALPSPGNDLIRAVPLSGPGASRTIGIVRRRDRFLSPAAQAVAKLLHAIAEDPTMAGLAPSVRHLKPRAVSEGAVRRPRRGVGA